MKYNGLCRNLSNQKTTPVAVRYERLLVVMGVCIPAYINTRVKRKKERTMDIWIDRKISGQTDRQIDRQIDISIDE